VKFTSSTGHPPCGSDWGGQLCGSYPPCSCPDSVEGHDICPTRSRTGGIGDDRGGVEEEAESLEPHTFQRIRHPLLVPVRHGSSRRSDLARWIGVMGEYKDSHAHWLKSPSTSSSGSRNGGAAAFANE
jgi:hypothetical protein